MCINLNFYQAVSFSYQNTNCIVQGGHYSWKILECNEMNRKRKHKMIEIAEVTGKKRTAESCITILEPDIESYCIAAEEKINLSFLARANSFCRTLHKKKELISELDCALEKLNDELNRDLSKQFWYPLYSKKNSMLQLSFETQSS